MALIVLDASVVIAHRVGRDAHHEAVVALLEEHATDELVLPTSAYAESLVGPARSGRLEEARARSRQLSLRLEPISVDIAERAACLRAERASLRLPDALVVATGDVLDADAVLTTDSRWSRFARVRVVS